MKIDLKEIFCSKSDKVCSPWLTLKFLSPQPKLISLMLKEKVLVKFLEKVFPNQQIALAKVKKKAKAKGKAKEIPILVKDLQESVPPILTVPTDFQRQVFANGAKKGHYEDFCWAKDKWGKQQKKKHSQPPKPSQTPCFWRIMQQSTF